MIDAHRASTHLLCSSGGVLRDAQPIWEVLGCGKLQLGCNMETPQFSNAAFTSITSSLVLFSSHIKRSWDEACLQWRAVDGLRWAFGCPGTWSPSLHVYWHLWTKHLPETRCDDQSSKDAQLQHSSLKATVCLQRNNVFRSSVNPSWCHDIKLWYVDYCTEVCHYGHHYFVYCWQNWPYLDDREEPGRLYLLDLSMNVKTCCRREFLITR